MEAALTAAALFAITGAGFYRMRNGLKAEVVFERDGRWYGRRDTKRSGFKPVACDWGPSGRFRQNSESHNYWDIVGPWVDPPEEFEMKPEGYKALAGDTVYSSHPRHKFWLSVLGGGLGYAGKTSGELDRIWPNEAPHYIASPIPKTATEPDPPSKFPVGSKVRVVTNGFPGVGGVGTVVEHSESGFYNRVWFEGEVTHQNPFPLKDDEIERVVEETAKSAPKYKPGQRVTILRSSTSLGKRRVGQTGVVETEPHWKGGWVSVFFEYPPSALGFKESDVIPEIEINSNPDYVLILGDTVIQKGDEIAAVYLPRPNKRRDWFECNSSVGMTVDAAVKKFDTSDIVHFFRRKKPTPIDPGPDHILLKDSDVVEYGDESKSGNGEWTPHYWLRGITVSEAKTEYGKEAFRRPVWKPTGRVQREYACGKLRKWENGGI
jgi:uncharacterized protein YodC (DUF2158 family)